MKKYVYKGPVLVFDKCVTPHWEASTCAVSPRKALSNLMHRFKQDHGKTTNTKVSLPGKLIVVEEEEV